MLQEIIYEKVIPSSVKIWALGINTCINFHGTICAKPLGFYILVTGDTFYPILPSHRNHIYFFKYKVNFKPMPFF